MELENRFKYIKLLLYFSGIPLFLSFLWFLSLDYGISYDESLHKNYGYFIYFYLISLGKNPLALSYINLAYYGGTFDFYSFLFTKSMQTLFNQNYLYEYRHFFNGLIATIGYVSLYFIGKLLHSRLLGIVSVVCLLFIPEYVGHTFINPKDIPFASFYTLSIMLLILYKEKPNNKLIFYLLAVCIGLALGVRILGVFLWIIFFTIHTIDFLKEKKEFQNFRHYFLKLLILGSISYLVAISTWPFLLKNPIQGAYLSLKTMADFPWDGQMKFLGQLQKPSEIGRSYIYILFMYTLPDFMLLIIVSAIGSIAYFLYKRNSSPWNSKTLILFMGSIFPLVLITITGSTMYSGYRQVFFIIPSALILFLFFIIILLEELNTPSISYSFSIVIHILMIDTGYTIYKMHPYEYIYFNRSFSGGMEKGSKLFDIDYWSISLKEASEYLSTHVPKQDVVYRISNTATPDQTDYYLNRNAYMQEETFFYHSMKNLNRTTINDPNNQLILKNYHSRIYSVTQVHFPYTDDSIQSDFLLSDTVIRHRKDFIGEPIYTVERLSIPICSIYKRK
jgi:hypothetical protein